MNQTYSTAMIDDYINGFIERKQDGRYEGKITIDGISLPSISAVFFKEEDDSYIWLKRKKVLEYDFETQTYRQREAKPQWEVYMKKQLNNKTVAYKGEFFFLHFKYSIEGVWDVVFGKDKRRLNLFVKRFPISKQTIINSINEQKKQNKDDGRTV